MLGLGAASLSSAAGCLRPAPFGVALEAPGRPIAGVGSLSPDHPTFAAGVWAGDARSDSFVVGTRCFASRSDLARGVELIVHAEPEGGGELALAHRAWIEADETGFVYARVPAMRAHTRHRYYFRTHDRRRSAVGWVSTAPAADATPTVNFLATSCSNARFGPFYSLVHAVRAARVDFWVHAGDHAYCDGASSLDALRARYLQHWSIDGLRALHASAGGYVTWDDHEVSNNWTPERTSPEHVARARRVMIEHSPIERDEGAAPVRSRLWRSFRWGKTLELFVLDARSERRRRGLATPEYLSRAQLEWLIEGVRRSPARFKVIVNSVPIARFDGLFALARDDGWLAYAAQREALLDAIRLVPGVLFVSGDYHIGVSARVERAGPYRDVREVLVGASGSFPNPAAGGLSGSQWDFVTTSFTCSLFECDPHRNGGELTVRYVDDAGRVVFRDVFRG
jgi:alkaline phosphatase D